MASKKACKPASPPAAPRAASLRLKSGTLVELDGDLVYLIDTLYRDLAVKSGFAAGYPEVHKEIQSLVGQMSEEALREYFAASLFLNYVAYENEMAERLTQAIAAKAKRARR